MPVNTRFKMPKASKYVKNVGRSIAYASIDHIKEQAPGITNFLDDNQDLIKNAYGSVKNYRDTMRKMNRSIKQSNVYKALDATVKNLVEDAKTGNLYNKQRDYGNEVMGFDEFDEGFELEESGTSAERTSAAVNSIDDAIGAAAMSTSTAVAAGTEMVIKSSRMNNTLILGSMNKIDAKMTAGFGSVYNQLERTYKFLDGPVMAHMENSRLYYETTTKLMQEQNAMMKELLDMQRYLYKKQETKGGRKNISKVFNSDGSFNLASYFEHAKKNIMNEADFYGLGMLGGGDSNGNMLMALAQNPWGFILPSIISSMMPKRFKGALKSFDKGVSTMFSQGIAKLNNRRGDGGLMGLLADLFGFDMATKKTINTGNYEKGPVPFDGITRKSIVEVIPAYLARIESALTGKEMRHFDTRDGKWKTSRDVHDEFRAETSRDKTRAFYDVKHDTDDYIRKQRALDPRKAAGLEKSRDRMFERIWNDGGDFVPYGKDRHTYYGFKDEKEFKKFVSQISRDHMREIATNVMSAHDTNYNRMTEIEQMGGIYNALYNGQIARYDSRNDKFVFSDTAKAGRGTGLLAISADESGNNVFWYLKEILAIMRNRGGDRAKGKTVKPKPVGPGGSHRESSEVFGSEDSEGGESGDDVPLYDWYSEEEERRRAAMEQAEKNKGRNFIYEKFSKSKIGSKLLNTSTFIGKMLDKPIQKITEMFEKADQSMLRLMFGDMSAQLTDDNGRPVESVFEYLKMKITGGFKEITDWAKRYIRDKFLESELGKRVKGIKDQAVEWARSGFRRAGQGLNNTFGKFGRRIFNADDVAAASAEYEDSFAASGFSSRAEYEAYKAYMARRAGGAVNSARGRIATKRGMTMISPGEIIIPATFDKREQEKQLSLEKKEKKNILSAIKGAKFNAKGSFDSAKVRTTLEDIWYENKDEGFKRVGAGGILGGLGGLLTGINPLLGAIAGAGLSILDSSDTLKSIMFGRSVDGERQGGVIPKSFIDFFKKSKDDAIDFGVAGGVLGLFTPFGMLGGAALGAAGGFLKNSEKFNKFVFGEGEEGEGGILSRKKVRDITNRIKDAAPSMTKGAIAGIIAGPFGLIGNAALGAGLGFLTTTETFQKVMFGDGEDDEGIAGAFKYAVIDPIKDRMNEFVDSLKDYSKKNILEPMKNFWDPFNQMLKNIATSIGDSIKDHTKKMMENTIGSPLKDFLQEKLFKPISRLTGGLLGGVFKAGKAVVAAPFKGLEQIGHSIRARQINRGTALNMSATERLQFRKDHNFRHFFSAFNGTDKMRVADEMLAGMDSEQLNQLITLGGARLNTEEQLAKNAGKARSATGKAVSNFLNEIDDTGKKRFDRVKYEKAKAIQKAAAEGDMDRVKKLIRSSGLNESEQATLINQLSDKVESARIATNQLNASKMDKNELKAELEKVLGRKVSDNELRTLLRNAEVESKYRRGEEIEEDPAEAARKQMEKLVDDRTQSMINAIRQSNEYLRKLVDPSYQPENIDTTDRVLDESGKPVDADSKEGKEAEQEREEDDARDEENLEENKKTSGILARMYKALTGRDWKSNKEDKSSSKKGGGLLASIHDKITGLNGFFGIGKVGKIAKIAVGASLLGFASEWFKNTISPGIKSFLFGTTNADGTKTSNGLLGGFKTLLLGDEASGKKGLLGGLLGWFNEKYNAVKDWLTSKGGLSGIFTNILLPKMIQGWSLAADNIVAPAVALIIKSLPNVLASTAAAIIKGLKMAFFNKEIGNRTLTITPSNAQTELESIYNSRQSALKSQLGSAAGGALNSVKNVANAFKIEPITLDLGQDSETPNDKKTTVGDYLLGSQHRTNEIEYDENGNITTQYVQNNKTGSIASHIAGAAGRSFIRGFGLDLGKSALKVTDALGGINAAKSGIKGVGGWISRGLKGIGKLAGKTVGGGTTLGLAANTALHKSGGKLLGKVDDVASGLMKKAVDKGGVAKGLANVFSKLGEKLAPTIIKMAKNFDNSTIVAETVINVFKKIADKISNQCLKKLTVTASSKIANAALGVTPLGLALIVADFISGMHNAETYLGIAIDENTKAGIGQKILCGLLNAVNNRITFGLLPTEVLVDIFVDHIGPMLGIDNNELQAQRDQAQATLDKWNKENPDRTFDNIEDYNDYQKNPFRKGWDKIKNIFSGKGKNLDVNYSSGAKRGKSSTNAEGRSVSSGKARAGRAHAYQSSRAIANMRYGDSTIGEAGCAPVAATNLINDINGSPMTVDRAARFAENHGMTTPGGGTDIRYFNSLLNSQGIPNVNTSNKDTVMKALGSGNQVVMLGQDKHNRAGAPFGTEPHYVTAKGLDRFGNIIAEDPDLPQSEVVYDSGAMLNSMISSVVAGRRRGKGRRRLSGRARSDMLGHSRAEATSYSNLGPNAIINVAQSQVGINDGGNNRVKYNTAYWSQYNGRYTEAYGSSYPWCCAFVWWVFNMAGARELYYGGGLTATSQTLREYYAKHKQIVSTPQAGDIVFFNWEGGSRSKHVGIVRGVTYKADGSINKVLTIEGNTAGPKGSQDNGGHVMLKERTMQYIVDFARPAYPYKYQAPKFDMAEYGDSTNYKKMALNGGQMTGDTVSLANSITSNGNRSSYSSSGSATINDGSFFSQLVDNVKGIMKKMYGGLFDALYGTDDDTATETISTASNASSYENSSGAVTPASISNAYSSTLTGSTNAEKIWRYLRKAGYSKEATAGIMGNLKAESGLLSNNIQNSYEARLGSDSEYTKAVNSKTRDKETFSKDGAGYGLAQWTYHTRKRELYEKTVEQGKQIDDLKTQLDYLVYELNNRSEFKKLNNKLLSTNDVTTASNEFLEKFENPAVKNYGTREGYSRDIYEQYKNLGDGTGSPALMRGGNVLTAKGRAPTAGANTGSAAQALNSFRSGGTSTVANELATAMTGAVAATNTGNVDSETFFKTVITILMSIADNTAILTKILQILSDNFDIKLDPHDIESSANKGRAEAQEALDRLIRRSSGNNTNVSSLLQNKDTGYILSAMTAIARE